jgi:hypothetical protein
VTTSISENWQLTTYENVEMQDVHASVAILKMVNFLTGPFGSFLFSYVAPSPYVRKCSA